MVGHVTFWVRLVSFIIYTTLMNNINMRNMTGLGVKVLLYCLFYFWLEYSILLESETRHKARQHFWG